MVNLKNIIKSFSRRYETGFVSSNISYANPFSTQYCLLKLKRPYQSVRYLWTYAYSSSEITEARSNPYIRLYH
jgi:hypothetical protein